MHRRCDCSDLHSGRGSLAQLVLARAPSAVQSAVAALRRDHAPPSPVLLTSVARPALAGPRRCNPATTDTGPRNRLHGLDRRRRHRTPPTAPRRSTQHRPPSPRIVDKPTGAPTLTTPTIRRVPPLGGGATSESLGSTFPPRASLRADCGQVRNHSHEIPHADQMCLDGHILVRRPVPTVTASRAVLRMTTTAPLTEHRIRLFFVGRSGP